MRNNNLGIMSFTLSQLALIIATTILLTSVFLFIYYNDWGREGDMKGLGSSFTSFVEGMDSRFFENRSVFWFADKNYDYTVFLSHEYVVVESEGSWGDNLREIRRFNVRPWITSNNMDWVSGEELHDYLENDPDYLARGSEMDPLVGPNLYDRLIAEFNNLRDIDNVSYAKNPFMVDLKEPVFVEKVYLFFDMNSDGVWVSEDDEKYTMIIVYQK